MCMVCMISERKKKKKNLTQRKRDGERLRKGETEKQTEGNKEAESWKSKDGQIRGLGSTSRRALLVAF